MKQNFQTQNYNQNSIVGSSNSQMFECSQSHHYVYSVALYYLSPHLNKILFLRSLVFQNYKNFPKTIHHAIV